MWATIPESIKELHQLFKIADKSLFVVGGSVRDFLNNEKPKDYDLATDATPDEILSITKNYRNHLHGESFGVVVVYTDDGEFEIATFREDVYGDKLGQTRNPDVVFTTIDKDVLRRDLTYNALFYDLDKQEVVDLVGGVQDLKDGVTKFVGDPEMRIIEDPLRIQRLFRFTKRYDFVIDEASYKAIVLNIHRLGTITRERVWEEIKKAFVQVKDFQTYLKIMFETGALNIIFRELDSVNFVFSKYKYLTTYFAITFKSDTTVGLLDTMKFQFKMDHDFSRKVVFLIDVLGLTSENALEFHKKREVSGISTDELLEWYRVNGLMKSADFRAFLYYAPTVSATLLMKLGFKGKTLGEEIKKKEIEKFKLLLSEV